MSARAQALVLLYAAFAGASAGRWPRNRAAGTRTGPLMGRQHCRQHNTGPKIQKLHLVINQAPVFIGHMSSFHSIQTCYFSVGLPFSNPIVRRPPISWMYVYFAYAMVCLFLGCDYKGVKFHFSKHAINFLLSVLLGICAYLTMTKIFCYVFFLVDIFSFSI